MKIRIIVLIGIITVFASISLLWFKEATSPVSRQKVAGKKFVVSKGENIRSIASRLEQEGLIRSKLAFFILVRKEGLAKKIQAGNFHLSPSMDARSIAYALTKGTADIWITILEGWRVEEIALELASKLAIPEQEFLAQAEEGYMFPDSYLIPKNASASAVAAMFRKNFDRRVNQQLREEITRKGLTLHQVVTLASIVEREVKFDEDRPIVAGILLKRWKNNWPLQADATVQYALGYQSESKRWWKRHLTNQDLKIDSPYNTYINQGLPPGPICNPGLKSIEAVVYPKESKYWFYLSDDQGKMHYAETIEEHQININRYLELSNARGSN